MVFLCGALSRSARANPSDAAAAVQQIVAHRGASAERPECTLAALQRAIEVGATAVEVDVRTSRDGKLFLLHDTTLDRTTNGKGRASERTLADLKKLDAGKGGPRLLRERIVESASGSAIDGSFWLSLRA